MNTLSTSLTVLAQASVLSGPIGNVIDVIQIVAMALAFIAVTIAGVMVMTGRNEYVFPLLMGAVICALAWVLVTALFGAVGIEPVIDPTRL